MRAIVKDLNFVPEYLLENEHSTRKQAIVLLSTVMGILVICSFVLIPKMILFYYQNAERNLDQEISKFNHVQEKIKEQSSISQNVSSKENIIKDIDATQIKVTEIIQKIKDGIPDNVYMRSYSISEKRINASFEINSPVDLVNLITSLEDMDLFSKVTVGTFPIVDKNEKIGINLELK